MHIPLIANKHAPMVFKSTKVDGIYHHTQTKPMTNPLCPTCTIATIKHGKTPIGSQRYRCKVCGYTCTDSGNPKGRPLEGDRPMTDAERYKRYRSTPEGKRKESDRQRKRRAKKRSEKKSENKSD